MAILELPPPPRPPSRLQFFLRVPGFPLVTVFALYVTQNWLGNHAPLLADRLPLALAIFGGVGALSLGLVLAFQRWTTAGAFWPRILVNGALLVGVGCATGIGLYHYLFDPTDNLRILAVSLAVGPVAGLVYGSLVEKLRRRSQP